MAIEAQNGDPTTLAEAVRFFAIHHNAHSFLSHLRWPDGVFCPHCLSRSVRYLANYQRFQCMSDHPARQFTIKTGSEMEDSAIPIEKWAVVFWCEANLMPSPSSYAIHRALRLRQPTAWRMVKRAKAALRNGFPNKSLAESP
jgi:hypothetical protein